MQWLKGKKVDRNKYPSQEAKIKMSMRGYGRAKNFLYNTE